MYTSTSKLLIEPITGQVVKPISVVRVVMCHYCQGDRCAETWRIHVRPEKKQTRGGEA